MLNQQIQLLEFEQIFIPFWEYSAQIPYSYQFTLRGHSRTADLAFMYCLLVSKAVLKVNLHLFSSILSIG